MQSFLILVLSLISHGSFQATNKPESQKPSKETLNHKEEKMTTYFFIRHAEKDMDDKGNKNPGLSKEGLERTEKWIELFRETEFDYIYSSGYKRTDQTAKAIATAKNLEISKYDASRLIDDEFQKMTKGKIVLIVGHSNTNPTFVNKILEENKYGDLQESEYGSLFMLHIAPDDTKTSHVLYIN